jgi:hypothetical protein
MLLRSGMQEMKYGMQANLGTENIRNAKTLLDKKKTKNALIHYM